MAQDFHAASYILVLLSLCSFCFPIFLYVLKCDFSVQFQTLQSIDDEMTSASSWQKVGTTLVQLDDMAQSAYSNDRYVI